jgi:hypothetical protein
MISTGMSIFCGPSVNPSSGTVLMQSYYAFAPLVMPGRHRLSAMTCKATAPERLKPQKGPAGTSAQNCTRLGATAARKLSKTLVGKPPGLFFDRTMSGVLAVKRLYERRQVAGGSLHGATVAAAIVCDDAIVLVQEEWHLTVPASALSGES